MIPKDEVAARLVALENDIKMMNNAVSSMLTAISQIQQLIYSIDQKMPQKVWYTKTYGSVSPSQDAIWRWG